MTNNVLCRYFVQGACAFGDKCRFSHNRESNDEPSQVCRYYLAGNCAYGDKCRYQHSKPAWSSRGQPPPPSNYSAPSGVSRPPVGGSSSGSGAGGNMVKLPSGASEFGMVEAAPNWDDYMTPDEMDEFEQWQEEQAMAAATHGSRGEGEEDEGDIMDPADIPLCNEFAATGGCSAGEECCYIHGDQCEVCGYFCIHPYNPDVTAHHQMACSEAMAAATAGAADSSCNGSAKGGAAAADKKAAAAPAAAAADKPKPAAAEAADKPKAAAEEGTSAAAAAGCGAVEGVAAADAAAAAAEEEGDGKQGSEGGAPTAAAAAAAGEGDAKADGGAKAEGDAAAAEKLADELSAAKVCQQYVLDPTDAVKAQQHRDECTELATKLAKRVRDAAIECGICYEKVMSKREMSQRRFGLMACDHAFCLGCIRNWRATGEVDAKTALRTCPVCRTTTHFITPSTSWPETPADKAAIVDAYKASMADKDCVHFDFGDGSCPFGTSCFYRHAYRDGRLEEVQLRRAGDADGGVKFIAPVTLSSFLEASLTAQLALSSRRPRVQQGRQQQTQQAQVATAGGQQQQQQQQVARAADGQQQGGRCAEQQEEEAAAAGGGQHEAQEGSQDRQAGFDAAVPT